MTVINPNSVAGINSITVQSGNSLSVHKSNGELIRTITSNTGVSTFSSISVGTATTDNSAAKSINIGLGASIAQHNDNSLTFGTNGDPRITIDASGDFNVGSAATIKAGGNATFSGIVTAASFVGDGSGLTGAGPTLTGSSNNTVVTVTGANAIAGESNLTFDGATLTIDGTTTDTPLILTSTNAGGSHLRFQLSGSNKHFVGSGGGFGLGDVDDLSLRTVDNIIFGVSTSEKVRIDSSGRLGIGTNNPGQTLHLSAASGDVYNRVDTNVNGGMLVYVQGTQRSVFANDSAFSGTTTDTGIGAKGNLLFRTGTSSYDERLRIASDGNVHINTTDNGTANAKLNIEDSSSVGVNVLKLINKPSSSNGKARLELYAETSGGQGATAYIQSISGTDADGSNSANDAGLEFHTGMGGSGTDVTAWKIDNSGKTTISTHEGNDALHLIPLASASTSIVINTWPDNSNGRNWAIRNRYNDHGRLEFMRSTANDNDPLTPVFVLNRDSSCSFSGSLSKASGSFKIDHPLPSKTSTHHLVHSFIEGPQADLIYRGKVDLVGGTSTVNIDTVAGMSDGTFVLLNREVQCFTSNETGWTAVKGSVSGNVLTITAQDNSCTDTISWMVVGERKDPHMYDTEWTDADGKVILEPLKETEVSLGGG